MTSFSRLPNRVLIALAAAAVAGPALAQDPAPSHARPVILDQLLNCRATADSTARLACFDAAVTSLDAAERQGDVIVVDRAQVAAARRQLFGFELPSMPGLFERGARPDPIEAIETTLVRARPFGNGMWVFVLADGTTWRQVNMEATRFSERPGQNVRVRRAAMGSYLLTVGNGRAVRVRRDTE